jgi:GGDEF domain-containing protein
MRTNDFGVKPPAVFSTTERRVALERRRRVAEMSRGEMERELLTSEVTGLPNRRAFDEAGLALAVAMCDRRRSQSVEQLRI